MAPEPRRRDVEHDIDELKQFIVVHARAQGLPPALYEQVLVRVEHDGEGPGSWCAEWSQAARRLEADGQLLEACQCWNTARFPYVDGAARAEAMRRCVAAFHRWRDSQDGAVERVEVTVDDGAERGRFPCLAAGLSAAEPRPLLVVMGGIVSVKEQWAPALLLARQLGLAMVVAEMPGVGENPLMYRRESWHMLSAVLDALEGRADVSRTYTSTMSFSGHLALRCALHDARIRGVVTAGAPITDFFTDRGWYDATVPVITKDTLAHLTGLGRGVVFDRMRSWALTEEELANLRIPVGYTVSLRDEIIPRGDVEALVRAAPDVVLNEHDDVHGSPEHVDETRAWTVETVLRMMQTTDAR